MQFVRLYNDLAAHQIGDRSIMIELGDLYADEARHILLKFKVPAMAALGLAKIATLELAYVELPRLIEHTATLPITVNVVPGDQAAGRVPNPTVASEILFQEAQDNKRQASEAFERGDVTEGKRLLRRTTRHLSRSLEAAPEDLKPQIRAELDDVNRMDTLTDELGSAYLSKMTRDSYHSERDEKGHSLDDQDGRPRRALPSSSTASRSMALPTRSPASTPTSRRRGRQQNYASSPPSPYGSPASGPSPAP